MMRPKGMAQWARVFAVLLVAATALFVVGITLERNEEPAGTTTGETATGEATEGEDSEGSGEEGEPAGEEGENAEDAETVLGIDVESPAAIWLGVLAAVALAGAAWLRPRRWVLLAGAAYCLAALVLDVGEVLLQLDEQNGGIATLAVGVAVLHLLAAGAAGIGATQAQRPLEVGA